MTHSSNIYLHDIALDEARSAWAGALLDVGAWASLLSETVPLDRARGRVTAAPVWARISAPHYHASAMDGYAVRSEDTTGATETQPKQLAIGAQAVYVDTGDPLPVGMNAVVMIEQVQEIADQTTEDRGRETGNENPSVVSRPPSLYPSSIEILQSVPPWQHVRAMGEDMVASELVLPVNHRIRPQDIGALAGCGHSTVSVYRRPRVAIIPTGSELVPPGHPAKAGEIIEYNSLVLGALAEEAGCDVTRYPIHKDDYDAIKQTVQLAMRDHDLVMINAGSSAGKEDFTSRIMAELGRVVVHGVAIRPGHPIILGVADVETRGMRVSTMGSMRVPAMRGVALVGIPGYPVSAAVTFDLLVRPLLYRWQGQLPPERHTLEAALTRKLVSSMGDDEFVRVMLGQVGGRIVATPLAGGAGVITSLVKADGVLHVPRYKEGHHAGERVTVELMRERRQIDHTIVVIGSHDMTLDVLGNALSSTLYAPRLVSSHVGSLGGLMALQRGEAHVAGSHLLDEGTGDYNVGYINELLSAHGIRVVLLGFVKRMQGLMVRRGNPKSIQSLADLTRADVTFINRQRGAGTRVLLDFQLKQSGIAARQIRGYERQEYTHLSVAAAVASGSVDCGLGILAAARALNVDFVPLFNERYDLVIPVEHYESELLQPMLAVIRDPAFAQQVLALGGYEIDQMGVVLAQM